MQVKYVLYIREILVCIEKYLCNMFYSQYSLFTDSKLKKKDAISSRKVKTFFGNVSFSLVDDEQNDVICKFTCK